MSISKITYIHKLHENFFLGAAKQFNCHILVRETGLRSIQWIGKPGYTGKRGDLKAKTADQNGLKYMNAGLVCSPITLPEAFSKKRYFTAVKAWYESEDLITDLNLPEKKRLSKRDVKTPYFVDRDKSFKHYGSVQLINDHPAEAVNYIGKMDNGKYLRMKPKRVEPPLCIHGDYDLYAIIPAGKAFDVHDIKTKDESFVIFNKVIPNTVTSLWRSVAIYINSHIQELNNEFYGSIMVQHGSQVNLGGENITYETALAFSPFEIDGSKINIVDNKILHNLFYKQT